MAKSTKATQEFVPIKKVRDGTVVLKDGTMLTIFIVSSLNFALKSTDEQNAIISQFQNFINSLEFFIQISIQSRKLDIRPYVALLEEQNEKANSDLMQIQIKEYIEFVKNFVESSNIMEKNFFIVIPYTPSVIQTTGNPFGKLFGTKKKSAAQKKDMTFEENISQLEQRAAVVEQGITRTGVRVIKLNTEEIIELYYKIFNPGELEKPIKLDNSNKKNNTR